MGIVEALELCKAGHKVRPVCWRTLNPYSWVEARGTGENWCFAEYGTWQEIPHALRMQNADEFLGEWEVVVFPTEGAVKP